jgi:phenylacetate-CoA ligase
MYQIKRFVFENIKNNIPNCFNDLIIKLNTDPSLVFGADYKKYFDRLAHHNGINPNIEQELLNIVNFTLANSPYYKKRYKDKKINSIEDFKNTIEPINKQTVLDNFDDFIVDKHKCDLITTGGTSGRPLSLYLPKNRFITELATLHYTWSKVGYNFSTRAVIRNEKLPDGKDFIINPISKEYIFDGFKLNDDYFEVIFKTLKRKNIKYVHGYTSNLFLFGKFLIEKNKDYSFIKGLFTTSENLTPLMESFFENTLKIPHINFYGHSEKLVFGAFCKDTSNYHIDSFYGYTELLNDECCESDYGEITGTTLHNLNMPLLRYKTGDFAERSLSNCTACGFSGLTLKKIHGRWAGSRIYNKDGTFITTTALNLHNDIYYKIDGIQYFQEKKGVLDVRVIKRDNFDEQTKTLLEKTIKQKFNSDFEMNLVFVNDLEKLPNGKFLLLISKI